MKFLDWATQEWNSYASSIPLTDEERDWLIAETERQSNSSLSILKTVITVVFTVIASVVSGLSATCFIAMAVNGQNGIDVAFAMLFFPSIALSFGLYHAKLKVPAVTLAVIGLLGSLGLAAFSEFYFGWSLFWFTAIGGYLFFSRSRLQHSLLFTLGSIGFIVFAVRLSDVRSGSIRLVLVGLAVIQIAAHVYVQFGPQTTFFKYRLRLIYLNLTAFIGLSALQYASMGFGRAYDEINIVASLLFILLATTLVIFEYRRRSYLTFGMALTQWIFFLIVKYYDLFYELLDGALVSFCLGAFLVGLGQFTKRIAERRLATEFDGVDLTHTETPMTESVSDKEDADSPVVKPVEPEPETPENSEPGEEKAEEQIGSEVTDVELTPAADKSDAKQTEKTTPDVEVEASKEASKEASEESKPDQKPTTDVQGSNGAES